MIMTAELNSHQRVSYYTGRHLIRHHQSASSANPSNGNNNTNSTFNSNNNSSSSTNSAATTGGFYHQHSNHYPPHPPPHPHHHHHHQQHPPPLPPHHPGHFHLPCPTGPPHIQHPGAVLHLGNHHGPPHPAHHHNPNGHHNYGGGGSNQTTRLYTGSPLIRSTGYHSVSGGSAGGLGSHKRLFKSHPHKNNLNTNQHNHHHHHGQHASLRGGSIGNPNHHHHHQNIVGSCSSGSNSSSSSNEHLNNLQSPTGSPLAQTKLDISPLKLSSSPILNGESSSSNNSSPGPQGSPSPSTSSNLSSSSSPNSADVNKDLDHFYFLDEHWKPSNESVGMNINAGDMMDVSGSSSGAPWNSCGSPSPPTVNSTTTTALTMMVDQFFANGHNNNNSSSFGLVDDNNNLISLNNGFGIGGGGGQPRDLNNNIIGAPHPNLNEIQPRPDRFYDSISGFNSGSSLSSTCSGESGLFHFGAGRKLNGSSVTSTSTTVVNVETQIGTFNGQRDLEIRLCFIKGDHRAKTHSRTVFGESGSSQLDTIQTSASSSSGFRIGTADEESKAIATAIGDPFRSVVSGQEQPELQSSSDNEMDQTKGDSMAAAAIGNIGMPMANNKEIVQKS